MLEVRNLVKIYKTKNAADVKALDDVLIGRIKYFVNLVKKN